MQNEARLAVPCRIVLRRVSGGCAQSRATTLRLKALYASPVGKTMPLTRPREARFRGFRPKRGPKPPISPLFPPGPRASVRGRAPA